MSLEQEPLDNNSEESTAKSKGGRPKGSKNKPKPGRPRTRPRRRVKRGKGRPKGVLNKKKRGRKKGWNMVVGDIKIPKVKKLKPKKDKTVKIISQTLDAKVVTKTEEEIEKENPTNLKSEEALLDSILNPNLMTSFGEDQNRARELIINPDPIDKSYLYRGTSNIPAEGAQYEFTADMIEELTRCKNDIFYFAENYFQIVTIDRGKHNIELYGAQKRVLQSMLDNKYVILTASRQCGKSSLMTIYALWKACFQADQSILIVANKEDIASKIFKKVRVAYEQLPNFLKPGVKDYGKTSMTLENDSTIHVSTTTSTSARGTTISVLIIDEMSFIPRHIIEEFWSSVIPTISSGKKAKMFVVSTPFSTDNKFYEIYSQAEQGILHGWKAERIDWWDVPGRDEQWKRDAVSALGGSEKKFLQEYSNAFLDDSETAVGIEIIERFKKEKKEPVWTSDNKDYCVYEYPNPLKIYVIGVDVGEGIGRASTVAQVLDVTDLTNIKQVAVYSSSIIEPYHFANKLNIIGQSWGLPPILIERNNCGGQLIDALFYKLNYENLVSYSKVSTQEKYNKTRHLGVLSHTNIRTNGIANMRYWVNVLQTVHINDPITISELETFIKQPNGLYRKKNDKFYDDRVMSLIWALFILDPELCEQHFEIADYDMQHKPLLIKDNGYWDKTPEMYELKTLDKYSTLVPKPLNYEDEIVVPSLSITRKELETTQKQDFDLEELLGMGYEFVNPPEDSSDNYF